MRAREPIVTAVTIIVNGCRDFDDLARKFSIVLREKQGRGTRRVWEIGFGEGERKGGASIETVVSGINVDRVRLGSTKGHP